MEKPVVTIVIPCLNERKTLPFVLEKCISVQKEFKDRFELEILVSDNGSEDGSQDFAKSLGVRVENCPIKGYGAALDSGIRNAKGEIIVFADADDTYDFLESPRLIQKLISSGADMVIGSRLDGTIHKGAMPFLHRYLGTPVINWIINRLYAKKFKIRDSNSGFRCFKKSSYLSWDIRSKGMEFASEMLIKALRQGAKMEHEPVSLYPDKPGRTPHLKTWRDGMRHLLRILFYAPYFFQKTGFIILLLAFSQLVCGLYIGGIWEFYGFRIYGIHSLVLLSFAAIIGISIWNIGLQIATKQSVVSGVYARILNWSEDRLFFVLVSGFAVVVTMFVYLMWKWSVSNFQFLNFERELIVISTSGLIAFLFGINALTAHILKRD
ncbi:glycosyltransferase family 2 protein [Leptospira bourretii]|uniref:Glycosyltransferase family 2 protein n=1 Tax=Leptospira bourretii TaxID=2484962 RepID=A0A4R9IJV0_9LEPT|nr:glycosyltransferase family 2 protein [Leptospira bourretii]TGK79456.1 glycosyltransferase family 2 protein [Leptospira bourretii]TGK89665.1 glycosyltransferase family 2 protein [Leptospira bourretii]TGL19573.1 glycosyltransferase family 2 protein [Leptospira bourretii]TGL33623.1 glycosyltransferase family 2 protein [Leptospira bourretii]